MTQLIHLPLSEDLVDTEGVLAPGQIKRVSAATKIDGGVLSTVDGDGTPFSHNSVEDETGATEMRGSFVDGQAWFHDAGGLIAAYADTGNLLILQDPTLKAYGFIGEVGTGEAFGAELVTNGDFTNWTGDDPDDWTPPVEDANNYITEVVGKARIVSDGTYIAIDQSITTVINKLYKVQVTATAVASGTMTLYWRESAVSIAFIVINAATTYTMYITAGVTDPTIRIARGSVCDITFDDVTIKEVTEPAATAVHIYKEHTLATEGWNAIDTGIDYNADTAWDFDIYTNLMSSTGSTAQARFEDGKLLLEGEGTNLIPYSEDFNTQWFKSGITVSTGEDDPRGSSNATGLIAPVVAGNHMTYCRPTLTDNIDQTYTIFCKAGSKDWVKFRVTNKDASFNECYFHLSGAGSIGADTSDNSSIERLGTTSWYRVRITGNTHNGATNLTVLLYPAEANNDTSFSGDGSTIDTYVYGAQAEQTAFMTSYIPTNGIPVTRTTEAGSAADNGVSWTIPQILKNILSDAEPVGSPTDSQGTLLFDVEWGCDETDIAVGEHGLVNVRDGLWSTAHFNQTSFGNYDGTSLSTLNHPAFTTGDTITYASRWGDVDGNVDDLSAGFREAEGAWSFDATPANYDGDFSLGTDLRLSFGNLYPIHISNIRFLDTPLTQDQLAGRSNRNKIVTTGIF